MKTAQELSWKFRSSCRGVHPDTFFPDVSSDHEPAKRILRSSCRGVHPDTFFPDVSSDHEPAKRICRSCPVLGQCLQYALANDERFGVWDGMSVAERDRLNAVQNPTRRSPATRPARKTRIRDLTTET